MPNTKWSELSAMQLGRYAEYYAKMEFTSYGFDVYTSEVDDHGVDFIAKSKDGIGRDAGAGAHDIGGIAHRGGEESAEKQGVAVDYEDLFVVLHGLFSFLDGGSGIEDVGVFPSRVFMTL